MYILDLTNFQNHLTRSNSNSTEISLESGLKYNKIAHMYAKKLSFTWLVC